MSEWQGHLLSCLWTAKSEHFWVVFRSERAVLTIFPPYIMPNGTYERIKKFYDTLPLKTWSLPRSLLRAHSRWGRQVPNNVRFTGRWLGGCHLTFWMNDFVLHGRVPVQTRESWGLGLAKQRCHRQWVKAASNFKCLAHHTEQCLVVQHNILDKQIKVLPLLTNSEKVHLSWGSEISFQWIWSRDNTQQALIIVQVAPNLNRWTRDNCSAL